MGELQLTWGQNNSAKATYAVIDGFLWLNVLRKQAGKKNVWRSFLHGTEGPINRPREQKDRLAGELVWDQNAMTLTLNPRVWKMNGSPSWPQRYESEQYLEFYVFQGIKGAPLDGLQKHCDLDEKALATAINGRLPGPLCNLSSSSGAPLWLQREHAILTPWSINLGPVGMLPINPRAGLQGVWKTDPLDQREALSNLAVPHQLRVVDESIPLQKFSSVEISSYAYNLGLNQRPKSDHYQPNERGIVYSP